jgi:hypothetical protein
MAPDLERLRHRSTSPFSPGELDGKLARRLSRDFPLRDLQSSHRFRDPSWMLRRPPKVPPEIRGMLRRVLGTFAFPTMASSRKQSATLPLVPSHLTDMVLWQRPGRDGYMTDALSASSNKTLAHMYFGLSVSFYKVAGVDSFLATWSRTSVICVVSRCLFCERNTIQAGYVAS